MGFSKSLMSCGSLRGRSSCTLGLGHSGVPCHPHSYSLTSSSSSVASFTHDSGFSGAETNGLTDSLTLAAFILEGGEQVRWAVASSEQKKAPEPKGQRGLVKAGGQGQRPRTDLGLHLDPALSPQGGFRQVI